LNEIKDTVMDKFQDTVQELLMRNKSILDLITKFQDSNSRVNRAIVKSATQCGCIRINAQKQVIPPEGDLEEARDAFKTHIEGEICDNCRDFIEKEIGRNLFYLVSICNTLDLNLYDIVLQEDERVKLLGKYNLR
jgi:hypothetical protein